MSLTSILEERRLKFKDLSEKAIMEMKNLVSILIEHYDFDSVYVFGSVLTERFGSHSDVDIAIKGLKVEDFFKVYAFLIHKNSYKIDLKPYEDLTEDFKKKVISEGIKIG